VGHNLKFDLQKLLLASVITPELVSMTTLHDTQAMAHLLDENDRKALKYLAVKVLGYDDTVEVEIKSGPNRGKTRVVPKEEHRLAAVRRELKLKKEDGYHLLPREVLIPYALRDTEFTLRLYEKLYPCLRDKGVLDWYQVEIELLRALLDMESDGLRLNMEYLDATTSEYGVKAMTLWQNVIRLAGKNDLNLNSPAQLLEVFKRRGYHLDSTGEAELKKLDDDLARAILDYRGVYKVYKTYLKGLQDEQLDGLVHPSFNPTGARTGRLSSGSAKE
jgi:DNA polymerase I-like protein with 3'-5' exonuclease and polymerase domains